MRDFTAFSINIARWPTFFLNGPLELTTNPADPNSTKANFGLKTDQTDHRVDETLGIERIRGRGRRL